MQQTVATVASHDYAQPRNIRLVCSSTRCTFVSQEGHYVSLVKQVTVFLALVARLGSLYLEHMTAFHPCAGLAGTTSRPYFP